MASPSHHRPTWAEVDLDALARNIRILSRLVRPAQFCAVVKADAYGHGAVTVARVAQQEGAAALAVATVDEGIELREAEFRLPILILAEPERSAIEDALRFQLSLAIGSGRAIVEVIAAWGRLVDLDPTAPPPRIHLVADTGMHREGSSREVILEIAKVARTAGVVIEGVFSHFARADAGYHGQADTLHQLKRFEQILMALEASGIHPHLRHIANTAGAVAYPESRYDLVRFGIGMYGYSPSSTVPISELRPVLSLRSRVATVHHLHSGDAVSYGLRRPLARDSAVVVIPVGYADGVSRRLFDTGGEVLIQGHRFPIAGTVTMDHLLVDVGNAPINIGEEVTLIGHQAGVSISADEWAERLGTISYEVLTGIGTRVPRVNVGGVLG
ncbi:MAG: alanine racemase [Ferrimicrobium sp.]